MLNIVIIGATSAIAQATARRFAAKGDRFVLVARNEARVNSVAEDLKMRGASLVEQLTIDLCETDRHLEVVEFARSHLNRIDVVLLAHGALVDQERAEQSLDTLEHCFGVNALSMLSLGTVFGNALESQACGCLAVISSVAGDRGRRSNYVYGAAKAAITAFFSGMRSRLIESGVHVLTIKPGMIDTPMTSEFEKGILWSTPERVAKDIEKGIRKRKSVIYTPGYWRLIMFVIRAIPESLFKKMNI